ncbi:sugar-binding domain-containing protein [Mucilaginibacter sp. CSA2-8R]|uniref:glycoside hydrolase family 2 protein n=1 Tax=Mucilaginibacter sp. CSA2-8R TaxID=3141542 RepID=UPI00315D7AAC
MVYSQNIEHLNTWKLIPQSSVPDGPAAVSSPNFKTQKWVKAIVPGTTFYAHVLAGKEKDPDYGDNIYKVDKSKYYRPFWYRAEFPKRKLSKSQRLWINFNGVNKIAEIYINGHRLGRMAGLMDRERYDVTSYLNNSGSNAIAVLVTPPIYDKENHHTLVNHESPTYLASAGWDWMPAVPGINSGITGDVTLTTTGPVRVDDPWIQTELPNHHLANIAVSADLFNAASAPIKGFVKVLINPGNITIKGPVLTLPAKAARNVRFDKTQFGQLSVKQPKLWWPNGYGKQPLYSCTVSFETAASVSAAVTKKFGIRKVTADSTELNGPWKVYVNDVPVFLKGGNWGMSDYMLKTRGKDYETRIRLHKAMNYNIIRNWTGEVTDDEFYDYCDQYGLMVWDDFWLHNFDSVDSLDIFKRNVVQKVKRLRNHPCITVWCGANEGIPGGPVNGPISQSIVAALKNEDANSRLYFPRSNAGVTVPPFSLRGGSHNLSGSGVWNNLDPKTYFTDPHDMYLFSNNTYGLRSELGTATFVNIESFKKFMPKAYWVAPTAEDMSSTTNMWARHFFCSNGDLGGGANPVQYITDINTRYGKAASLEDFCKKAQLMNVETMKAMYEAWNDHLFKDATGLIIWMSQPAYPTMIWQTYDYYFDLTGSYFAAKAACEPIHIQWNAANNSVKVINTMPYQLNNMTAQMEVYNTDGTLVKGYTQVKKLNVTPATAQEVFEAFDKTVSSAPLSAVHFLKLKLSDANGKLMSENLYWVGNTYLNYQSLNHLPSVANRLEVSSPQITMAANGVDKVLTYAIKNTSKQTAAIGIRAQLKNKNGEQILPALFTDGYFSLMQGEAKTLQVEVDPKLLGKGYHLDLKAFNN